MLGKDRKINVFAKEYYRFLSCFENNKKEIVSRFSPASKLQRGDVLFMEMDRLGK